VHERGGPVAHQQVGILATDQQIVTVGRIAHGIAR